MYHTHWPREGEDRMKEIGKTNATIKFERTQGPQKPNGYHLQQPPPTMMKFHLNICTQQNHHTPEVPKQSW